MIQKYRVGADIGGTFTDLIIVNSETGEFTIGKTLTTPHIQHIRPHLTMGLLSLVSRILRLDLCLPR